MRRAQEESRLVPVGGRVIEFMVVTVPFIGVAWLRFTDVSECNANGRRWDTLLVAS
jgi:hypothetical protein